MTIRIKALSPVGFNFDRAQVTVPNDIDESSAGNIIIINRAHIYAGQPKSIGITDVVLGRGGGQTTFDIETFNDETRTIKVDEKIGLTTGFRLPGRITVSNG